MQRQGRTSGEEAKNLKNRTAWGACALALGLAACAQVSQPPPPQPIEEGMFVSINGVEQWITIRGTDVRNPVLLLLHGGPGFPSSGGAPGYAEWEKHFTLVQWDQPGGGGTYAKNIGKDIGPLTIERYKRDGIAVTEYALKHLNAKKLVIYGASWGTILGVEMAHARPELFSAYVGVSQSVGKRGGPLSYELTLKAARERGDSVAIAALEKIGPPPYETFEDYLVHKQYASPPGLPPKPEEEAAIAELTRALTTPPDPNASYIPKGLPPYNFIEVFLATIQAMFKEEEGWDAWALGLNFKMPVFIFNGEYDINTPPTLAMEYCNDIKAPAKACEIIPGAGHSTVPASAILSRLEKYVLPALSGKRR